MAGSRRSHKKSRNGCNRCRRRHVRCDESLPECVKCIRQNYRCDFLDGAPLALLGERRSRMLLPTATGPEQDDAGPEGHQPLLSLMHVDHGLPMRPLPPEEGRLLHHLTSNLTQTKAVEMSKYIVNVAYMPRFLAIAETFDKDFVREAALAVSASRFAYGKDKAHFRMLAQKHERRAVQGLRLSLAQFQKQNSDAILATSILLSWQALDETSFASFTCGTASIIEAMYPWRKQGVFLDDLVTNAFACASNLQVTRGILVPRPPAARNEQMIYDLMKTPLAEVYRNLSGHKAAQESITLLLELAKELKNPRVRTDLHFRFSVLQPGLSQFLWLPTLLKEPDASKWTLLVHAFWYALIMSLEPIRYAPVSQLLRSSCVNTVRSIVGELQTVSNPSDRYAMLRLMVLPLTVAKDMEQQINALGCSK